MILHHNITKAITTFKMEHKTTTTINGTYEQAYSRVRFLEGQQSRRTKINWASSQNASKHLLAKQEAAERLKTKLIEKKLTTVKNLSHKLRAANLEDEDEEIVWETYDNCGKPEEQEFRRLGRPHPKDSTSGASEEPSNDLDPQKH